MFYFFIWVAVQSGCVCVIVYLQSVHISIGGCTSVFKKPNDVDILNTKSKIKKCIFFPFPGSIKNTFKESKM